MNEQIDNTIVKQWQVIFKQLRIIEKITERRISEYSSLEFELTDNIILPLGYREFEVVFGSGYFGEHIQIFSPICYARSQEIIGYFKETLERELNYEREAGEQWFDPQQVAKAKRILDSALEFGHNFSGDSFVWDLASYQESDRSYDIYFVPSVATQVFMVGRDFVEFIREFALGSRAFEILPPEFHPYSNELDWTFTRWIYQ